jgi:hypothetical protein
MKINRLNSIVAATLALAVTFSCSLSAAPLPPGEEILILAPALEEGDEENKPVVVAQPSAGNK